MRRAEIKSTTAAYFPWVLSKAQTPQPTDLPWATWDAGAVCGCSNGPKPS